MNDCIPKPIEAESKYHSATWNCELCNNTECPYWKEWNVYENK